MENAPRLSLFSPLFIQCFCVILSSKPKKKKTNQKKKKNEKKKQKKKQMQEWGNSEMRLYTVYSGIIYYFEY